MEEACSIFEQKCNKIDLTLSLDSIQGIPRDSHQDAGEAGGENPIWDKRGIKTVWVVRLVLKQHSRYVEI